MLRCANHHRVRVIAASVVKFAALPERWMQSVFRGRNWQANLNVEIDDAGSLPAHFALVHTIPIEA
jgi:hypothetical protein